MCLAQPSGKSAKAVQLESDQEDADQNVFDEPDDKPDEAYKRNHASARAVPTSGATQGMVSSHLSQPDPGHRWVQAQ